MRKIRLLSIVGARPQFIKAAVISQAIRKFSKRRNIFRQILLHTGQHYDANMSDSFFKELQIPKPKYNLGIKETTHAQQTAKMMVGIEKILDRENPDLVIVYGDTNSTLSGALTAAKLKIPVAHIEAGLRSFNRDMPEEINRAIADHLSSYLFCPTKTAVKNLKKEGIRSNVFNVGDVMYDSIKLCLRILKKKRFVSIIKQLKVQNRKSRFRRLKLMPKSYYLATIHRAENTDNPSRLIEIFSALNELDLPVIIPIHPRTKKVISKYRISLGDNLYFITPVSYIQMIALEKNAKFILTDSGGVQKEAFFLRIPCITLRDQTEWVETVEANSNQITGADRQKILKCVFDLKARPTPANTTDLFGQGNASQRIVQILAKVLTEGV